MILEFDTQEKADACLKAINALAAQWWQSQGYTVEDGQLIGKNAKTGENAPNATRTITWDTVRESPDGTFYFASPSTKPQFKNWKQALSDFGFAGSTGTEKALPARWTDLT